MLDGPAASADCSLKKWGNHELSGSQGGPHPDCTARPVRTVTKVFIELRPLVEGQGKSYLEPQL